MEGPGSVTSLAQRGIARSTTARRSGRTAGRGPQPADPLRGEPDRQSRAGADPPEHAHRTPAAGRRLELPPVRRLFGPAFIFAGIMHFVIPRTYESIMPDYLPAHRPLVYASGLAEIAGGASVLHPRTRRLGSWFSIATLIAVFPANVHMAMNPERYRKVPGGRPTLLARLPVQAVFIAWAHRARR